MSERALQAFRERIAGHDLAQTTVSYRVAGGLRNDPGLAPSPPLDEVLVVDGAGAASVRSGATIVGSARLPADAVAALFAHVGASLPALPPRAEARFLPPAPIRGPTHHVAPARAHPGL